MPHRKAMGLAAFAVAAVGGTALGVLADRRISAELEQDDPLARQLAAPLPSEPVAVTAADGTVLHAEVHGPEQAPTLLFVHGLALNQSVWQYQRRALGERFRVVSFDLRGHGESQPAGTGGYSLAALAGDLSAVVQRCVPANGQVVLVGHSLGGMAVLECTRLHREELGERLAGVVLLNTAASAVVSGLSLSSLLAGASIVRARAARMPLLRRASPDPPHDLSFLLTKAFGLHPDAPAAVVAYVERLTLSCSPTVTAALWSTVSGVNVLPAARALNVPALVLAGEHDRLTPSKQARRLARELEGGSIVELVGAGHTTMLEAPDEVCRQLERFADEVLSARSSPRSA